MLTIILVVISISNTMATLLDPGTNRVEVREDYQYQFNLPLFSSFRFAGTDYSTVYISDNGVITFDDSFKGGGLEKYQYNIPWIAPYGADIGAISSSDLYYYSVSGINIPSTVTEIIQSQYPDSAAFEPSLAVVVTWQNVRQYPALEDNSTNTFQAVFATDYVKSFVIFLYEKLEWGPAVVGISSGIETNKFFICGSRTGVVKSLTAKSQKDCNDPGQFVFRVDSSTWTTAGYTCTQISTPRDCSIPASNPAARNRRCGAR